MDNMAHPLLARKRSLASLGRQHSDVVAPTTSDLPREEKSAKYRSPTYVSELANKGSFMRESDLGITDESKALCQSLLNSAQTVVQDSLFRNDRFKTACRKIYDDNEARVVQDITRLIVPSAETLATCGATHLEHLVESVNKGWDSAIPVTNPRPQPDYSVAFGQSAFTDDQLKKLKPFVGEPSSQPPDLSYFMATWRMYFPFLTCEVKCGASVLDIADRQNANSMTHAVRAVVQLYQHAEWDGEFDWKKEVHRKILAFSISHNDRAVRIYGHYPLIEDDRTTFYRYPIREFSLTDLDGKDKWTAYKFTKNVYESWMPNHLKWICKAIDALPANLGFEVSTPRLETETETNSQEMTESDPSSRGTGRSKKPRLKPTAMLQQEIDWLKQQLAWERGESKKRHTELMDSQKEQKEQMDRQIDELKKEKDELKREKDAQREQTKELTDLLKEQISGKSLPQ